MTRYTIRILLLPLIIPVAIVILPIFAAIAIVLPAINYVSLRKFRLRMKKAGRCLSLAELRHHLLSTDQGTIIVESPSMGWAYTNAWWTSEPVSGFAPGRQPTKEDYREMDLASAHPWDKFCWDKYTSPDTGEAKLLRIWNGAVLAANLKNEFPKLNIVKTWTAIPNLENSNLQRDSSPT